MPGNSIVLQPDAPRFTIIAATDGYYQAAGRSENDLTGKGLFEAFPSEDGNETGEKQLRRSLETVVREKRAHQMPLVRYDVINADGSFSERYWSVGNKPVLDEQGEVRYIIHTAEEQTAQVKTDRAALRLKSLERSYNLFMQVPITIGVVKGSAYTIELANDSLLEVWGRTTAVIGQPLFEAIPELQDQGFQELLDQVRSTGEPFHASEHPITLNRHGKEEVLYFDFVYKPYYEDGQPQPVGVLAVGHEVTAKVAARKKLIESEAKLRSILNSAPTAIGVFAGPDLILENPNQLMIEVLGAGPEIEGQSFRKLLAGLVDEDQMFLQLIDNVRSTGLGFEAREVPVYFKNQEIIRYFNINFIPLFDEHGTVYAVLDVSVDVSEQVGSRKNLEESEGRFRLLADASPLLIWMLTPEGDYAYVNQTTLDFLGISQEQMAAGGWEPLQHPDDIEATREVLNKALRSRQRYALEHRLPHKNGEYRWVLSQAIPAFDANGKVFAYVGSSIDIDEARKNREALMTALEQIRLSKEAAELGTFDMDLEKGTMHWDERCRTLFGISHQQEVTYEKDFVEGLHPDDRQRILDLIDRLFIRSVSNGDYDVEYRTVGVEDGQVRWVRAKGKVYFDDQDNPVRFIGSVLDITEKMDALHRVESLVEKRTAELAEANEQLLQANRELQRSNANLEEFAHAASHDLKEPVRKIHFFASQLRGQLDDRLTESEVRSFNRIQSASQRMGNLIDDLLLYSHVSQRPHETELVDLNEKLHRVLEDLDLDIEEKRATIRLGKLPLVNGYRRQLQQLFQNLVSNALKYSKADEPPIIEVEAEEAVHSGKRYHRVSVRDNGIGFEPEHAGKIFQMFTRLHGKAEYSGTGVGLSIVKKVVENHNGFIEVESEPGQGSTFSIYLPA